jgi:hypothetical protein
MKLIKHLFNVFITQFFLLLIFYIYSTGELDAYYCADATLLMLYYCFTTGELDAYYSADATVLLTGLLLLYYRRAGRVLLRLRIGLSGLLLVYYWFTTALLQASWTRITVRMRLY